MILELSGVVGDIIHNNTFWLSEGSMGLIPMAVTAIMIGMMTFGLGKWLYKYMKCTIDSTGSAMIPIDDLLDSLRNELTEGNRHWLIRYWSVMWRATISDNPLIIIIFGLYRILLINVLIATITAAINSILAWPIMFIVAIMLVANEVRRLNKKRLEVEMKLRGEMGR